MAHRMAQSYSSRVVPSSAGWPALDVPQALAHCQLPSDVSQDDRCLLLADLGVVLRRWWMVNGDKTRVLDVVNGR